MLLRAVRALQCAEYLLEWSMVKRLIDYEIEKNNDLATDIKGAVERQDKRSA